MNKTHCFLSSLIVTISMFSCLEKEIVIGKAAIIPKPQEMELGEGFFEIDKNTKIAVENQEQAAIADRFFSEFETVTNWKPNVYIAEKGDVVFTTDTSLKPEGYRLTIDNEGIRISAASGAGFFYALKSLKQLLPTAFYLQEKQNNIRWAVAAVDIIDEPRFEWRGYMLDVSRHFFDKEHVFKVLDFMADLKLNRFHWHLTDDQGWRVEINEYPKLTEVGAWRVDHNVTDETIYNWFGRPKQKEGEDATYGGYYTQDDIKEVVAYAKERHIEVIPEIDMPGHSQAIVAAYPELGSVNSEKFVATGGVVKNNTLNPGKEETYIFAKKMLHEIMELFPFEYIHIGGDECNKEQWRIDPHAQNAIAVNGLKDEDELQSYFIRRIEKIINDAGRKMVGWDEILEGGLAPNATVMSWRGESGGIESVKMGHEVIMTPSAYCYLDLKQGHPDLEPNLGYSELLLSTAYNNPVVPEGLTEKEAKLVKGVQGNMWTESISDWGKLTYMTFPRLYAIAESAWTLPINKDWKDFSDRLFTQFERLDAKQVRYAKSAISPWIEHKASDGEINISMKTEVKDLDIRYTLDGSDPSMDSPLYKKEFSISKSTEIRARAFLGDRAVGNVSIMYFPIHLAANQKTHVITGKEKWEAPKLTDLKYAKLAQEDPNWQTMANDSEIHIEFDEAMEIEEIKFEALRYTISGIYPPNVVNVWGSLDGNEFLELGKIDEPKAIVQGRNKIPYHIPLKGSKIKFLKVHVKSVAPIPDVHHLAGQPSYMAIDEIRVN